jgi:hypothetical protein
MENSTAVSQKIKDNCHLIQHSYFELSLSLSLSLSQELK